MKTNLELINDVDGFPYPETDPEGYKRWQDDIWTLLWDDENGSYPIGYILDRVYKELIRVPVRIKGEMDFNFKNRTIKLFGNLETEEERSAQVAKLTEYWREKKTFKLLQGWRNELWPVYSRKGELLFSVERAAMGLFGTMRYGVHMIAYIKDETAPFGFKFWVPRRAPNKSTFPNMLDNTVAGGLCTGEDPFECLVREADEEASLPEEVVRSGAKFTGNVTYIYITNEKHIGEGGFIYPECQWVYELELPKDVVPIPKDGEVAEFFLSDVNDTMKSLANGEYKSNCALCVIDFLIRRGVLTDENETAIKEIQNRIHREIPFPGPHKTKQTQS
ncbi:unnamed protein product [Clonostachys rosea]|uniref:Nudix hydrolase domain-containing protein n=1 Tax=Bionectria ochroleuca TaxID=29856 RepID=A0ABY6TNI7_BIOOC|nr:unnamed protein product [Clonostachys rosea]